MKYFIVFSITLIITKLLLSNATLNRNSYQDEHDDKLTGLLKAFLKYLHSTAQRNNRIRHELGTNSSNTNEFETPDHVLSRTKEFLSGNKAVARCGQTYHEKTKDKRIIGGRIAFPHSWPWQIRLLKKVQTGKGFKDVCGGTIIDTQHVITAAHCVWNSATDRKYQSSGFMVIAGDHDRSSESDGQTQEKFIKHIFTYSKYVSTRSTNDIAVLSLESPFSFNENVSNCCLPRSNPTKRNLCYATGWGDTEKGNNYIPSHSDLLRQVRLPLFSASECAEKFYGRLVDDNMICAGYEEGYKDTCQGDSGGPLVCLDNDTWILEGVTSWGIGCALPKNPGVYTKVASYLGWIESITGDVII